MSPIPEWRLAGDWFDICSCSIPCPCEFAQAKELPDADYPLVLNTGRLLEHWHTGTMTRRAAALDALAPGPFVEVHPADLARMRISDGSEAKPRMGFFVDDRADERQRAALQTIFGGKAGGWPAGFAALLAEMRGFEFVPITIEVAGDLAHWRAEIPGRVVGRAEALTGPTTPPGKRVQLVNPPGSEVGPGGVATWGRSVEIRSSGFGFTHTGQNWSSKHIPFDWSGPDPA